MDAEEGGRRVKEIPRIGNWTAEDQIKIEQARVSRRIGIGVLIFFGAVVAAFVTPLIVFLTRIAAGG